MADQDQKKPTQAWLKAARLARLKPKERTFQALTQKRADDQPIDGAPDPSWRMTQKQLRPDQAILPKAPAFADVKKEKGWFLLSLPDGFEEPLP